MKRLRATRCIICGTEGNATEIYPATFNEGSFTAEVFSARRIPDRVHYRIVRCNSCGLIRSDPTLAEEEAVMLYGRSRFDYAAEAGNIARTYGRCLAKLERRGIRGRSLLEIGCGNGFFLEEAMRRGYREVRGVEPSADAIAKAKPDIRERIVRGVMRSGLFNPGEFDVVCMFQVLDHAADPLAFLAACWKALRPGGAVLAVVHNAMAISARLLKERSPIIDIEHTYLFCPSTVRRLVEAGGFRVAEMGGVWNTYSLRYLATLVPWPRWAKDAALQAARSSAFALPVTVPLGNLYVIAERER